MASIFKPPKITQEQLSSTLLEYGEIVYNTTKNEFFTGNGTSGGITLFNEKPTTTSELINDSNFVTSSDVEESLSAYQPISGMNIYALKSEIPSGGSSTGDSYTFPQVQRTYICLSESISEDGTIAMQSYSGKKYNSTTGVDRYINNVIIIPSGAPSGNVDFVYEEVSGFVYNPFTTVKFQLDCIPSKEMPTLQEIYFIVEHDNQETVIATTEGLNQNKIHRYNGQNDNSILCSQVIELKNILADEFVSVIGDKVKLRFFFAYQYFGTSNQKNAPSDQKQTFTVGRSSVNEGYYGFFISINEDFKNPDLIDDPLKYYATINGATLTENIFDHLQIRYPVDALQNRNLAFMLNDTGIFGKIQNANWGYSYYNYNFNNYIDWSSDYALYDDILLNNKLDIGGKVRGYTLNGSVTLDANNYGGYFHFIMFNDNNISFDNIEKYFSIFPVFFVKHKIFIYNPNGFQLLYQDTNLGKSEDIISTSETGIIELNFYIDYDSIGLTSYSSDYYYVLEKINADGTKVKYPYKKNWY